MTQALDTLGKALRHNMLVVVTCRDCERQARFLARDLATSTATAVTPIR